MALFLLLITTIPTTQADMMTMPYTSVPSTSSSDSDYHYQVTVESYTSRLQYLGEYDLGDDGTFEIALDVLLAITSRKADAGRDMLYLLACDQNAAEAFLSLSPPDNSLSNIHVPSYCAMPNRTLDYYCQSFPLEDQSSDEYVYQSFQVVSGSMADMAPTAYSLLGDTDQSASADRRDSRSGSSSSTTVIFFIDACETLGGQEGILRSCLKNPPGSAQVDANSLNSQEDSPCFYCPNNYPRSYSNQISAIAEAEGCKTPPPMPPTVQGTVLMNLCNSKGDCLGKVSNFQPFFYGISSIVWGITAFVWVVHIRAAARDAVVELQHKMKLIPITQAIYSVLTLCDLYAETKFEGTARSLFQNAAVLAQLVALAVFAEMVVVIAKGWKITRPSLLPREMQWVRFVTLSWAGSFAILKHTGNKDLALVLVWGLSWACVVFMVWYNSTFNLNMLIYQLAMVRQLDVDPRLTPIYTKFMLFRRFRGSLATYMCLSSILGIMGLMDDATIHFSEWTSLVADEGLTWVLFVVLGYTFRCRRFGRLMQPHVNAIPQVHVTAVRSTEHGAVHRGSILPDTDPPDPEPPKPKKTIIVLNPDQAPWLATALESSEPVVKPATSPKSTVSP